MMIFVHSQNEKTVYMNMICNSDMSIIHYSYYTMFVNGERFET